MCVCRGQGAEGKVKGNANRRRRKKTSGVFRIVGVGLGHDKPCVALFRLAINSNGLEGFEVGEVEWRGTQRYVCLTKLTYFSVLQQLRWCMHNINTAECVQRD